MSYVDAFHNKKSNEIYVVERDSNGKKIFKTYPAKFVFYYGDANGNHKTIFGNSVRKFETNDRKKFQKELAIMRGGRKIYESDVDPLFRCIADNYLGQEAPDLHISFLDIEVNFDPKIGFSTIENPYAEINAISVHNNWIGEMVTLVLKPETMTEAQAQEVVRKFDNTLLCKDEYELLKIFLELIEDSDVLTGWNCIAKNEYVFLENKIKKLGDIREKDSPSVLAWNDSGLKKKNTLLLKTGQTLDISDEHVIPIFIKDSKEYKYPSTLLKSSVEKNISEIKKLIKSNKDVFVKIPKQQNNNGNLTYKDLLLNNLTFFLTQIDFRIDDKKLQDRIYNKIKLNKLDGNFIRTGKGYTGKSKINWRYSLLKNFVTKDDIFNCIKRAETLHIYTTPKVGFNLKLNQHIPNKWLKLLGFIFTDGFYSKYDKEFSYCNKDRKCIETYNESIGKKNKLKRRKDGCFYSRAGLRNPLGLLKSFIYSSKKELNVELFSQLSTEQFSAFFSGCIDGDGSVYDNRIEVCNFDNNIKNFTTLLNWQGVFTYTEPNSILIPNKGSNIPFIKNLKLNHSVRSQHLLHIDEQLSKENSASRLIKYFEFNDFYLVGIKKIQETNEYIEMSDIMTKDSYFVCNGIKVHNCDFFDIPYIIERIKMTLGIDYTSQMCLWNQRPVKREVEKFGKIQTMYDLIGKTSLDYLDLFKKHALQKYHSYRLDFIGEQEVGEKKIQYEGTLDQLYKKDFYKFIEYNRQDVSLLVKIDDKNKFIELANQVAHTNGVLLKTTMGVVQLVDQAIINEAHRRGMVVHDKIRNHGDEIGAAGAYVADPKVGLHEEIGAVDINSLYPSVIRSLNMCTETLIGQIAQDETAKTIRYRMDVEKMSAADAWHGMFGSIEYSKVFDRDDEFDVCLEIGNINDQISKRYMSAAEAHDFIFKPDSNFCISANGTIFRTDIEGIIPGLLTKWYKERQDMQAKKKACAKAAEAATETAEKKKLEAEVGFWDKRQYVRKILLNSLYGALLNQASRFYDHRLGQSVTLTGRCITRHMGSEINQLLTGNYDHVGDAVIYGDTDSVYFSAAKLFDTDGFKEIDWTKERIIKFYDEVGDEVNGTFANFMQAAFNVPENMSVIAAGRELVASRGLFVKKKRYSMIVYDMEGWRVDLLPEEEALKKKVLPGLGMFKAMGLDTKRSDTPKPIQDFLSEVLKRVLAGEEEESVLKYITEFRDEFKTWPAYLKGRPSSANKLDFYNECFKHPDKKVNGKKPTIPGHVRASIHWNMLREAMGDNYSLEITDGMKIITCKLRPNPMKWDSIAYPVDEFKLPEWFTDLPFDSSGMEDKIIDQKLDNLIGVLNWNLASTRQDSTFGAIFTTQKKK